MSQRSREKSIKKRNRTPIKATAEVVYEKRTRKSRAGVEYTFSKPVIRAK